MSSVLKYYLKFSWGGAGVAYKCLPGTGYHLLITCRGSLIAPGRYRGFSEPPDTLVVGHLWNLVSGAIILKPPTALIVISQCIFKLFGGA
jgi:hypothetical protein